MERSVPLAFHYHCFFTHWMMLDDVDIQDLLPWVKQKWTTRGWFIHMLIPPISIYDMVNWWMVYDCFTHMNPNWLVVDLPLWKIWYSQLGLLSHSIYEMESHKSHVPVTTKQPIAVHKDVFQPSVDSAPGFQRARRLAPLHPKICGRHHAWAKGLFSGKKPWKMHGQWMGKAWKVTNHFPISWV